MVNFYVTNQFIDKNKKLITANQTIIIDEERAKKLSSKNYGYITGIAEVKKEQPSNKNLISKK